MNNQDRATMIWVQTILVATSLCFMLTACKDGRTICPMPLTDLESERYWVDEHRWYLNNPSTYSGVWTTTIDGRQCNVNLAMENSAPQYQHYKFEESTICRNWKETPAYWDLSRGTIVLYDKNNDEIARLKKVTNQKYTGISRQGKNIVFDHPIDRGK